MDKKFWLKKAIQAILSQNKSDVEKAEEIVGLFESSGLSEEEHKTINSAIDNIDDYLRNDWFKSDAEKGVEALKGIFYPK